MQLHNPPENLPSLHNIEPTKHYNDIVNKRSVTIFNNNKIASSNPYPIVPTNTARSSVAPSILPVKPVKKVSQELLPVIHPADNLVSEFQYLSELNLVATKLPLYLGSFKGNDIKILIDSGASENYVSPEVSALADSWLPVYDRQVETAGGETTEITKKVSMNVTVNGFTGTVAAYVFPTKFDLILGRAWLKEVNPQPDWATDCWTIYDNGNKIKLVPCNDDRNTTSAHPRLSYLISHKQADRSLKQGGEGFLMYLNTTELNDKKSILVEDKYWSKLVKEFTTVFRDELPGLPPNRDVTHVINTGDAKPVSRPPFKMSPAELDELQKQIKELLSLGLIRPSASPWGAPVLFVRKKTGEMRMCVDYRAVNKLTTRNNHPLPRIDECLDRLKGASHFSSLDLKSGYHQVRINPEDVPKTAFNTRYGQFEFLVLPFGLTNAPPTFQSLMNRVLGDCLDKFALVYLDDILIFSETEEDHKKHVRHVLNRLKDAQLIANLKKCEFGKRELIFVGFKITPDGILPSPSKVDAVKNWPVLNNVQEVRQFMGLAQHYRRFIPGFASIAAPLTDLTRGTGPKKRPITWTNECQVAFDHIKKLLTSAPVLQVPDMIKPYRIETDASDFGCGAVLLQPGDDENSPWHPIAYESKKFSAAEKNYPAQERELLGIIHALRTWRCFVDGCKGGYTVFSDHLPLKYLRSQDKPTPRLVRWMAELELFAPDIHYKPGKDNDVPDVLSRMDGPDDPVCDTSIEPDYLYAAWSIKDASLIVQQDWPLLYLNPDKVKLPELKLWLDKHADKFVVRGSAVYRKVEINDKKTVKEVPFLPFAARADTVAKYHETFGHAGVKTMLKMFVPRFWWHTMQKDLKEWLKTCPSCQVNSRRIRAHQDVMHPLKVPTAFDRWHIDFVGELPVTLKGNRWLLVAVDYATNWPVARAVPVASKEAVADFIYEEIMMKFGCPSEILTDRGANFNSELVKTYLKRAGTHHKLTSAYHPRTNSKVERFNGVIKGMLRKYINGALHRWDDFVNAALWASRIRVHSTTGYSPFFLTYGREPRLPGDTFAPYIDNSSFSDPRTVADITSRELSDLGQHRAAATFKMKAMAEKDKAKWDSVIKPMSFEVGDNVMLSHEGRYGLEPQYKGPYIVVQTFPDYGTYKLETLAGEPLKSLVHVDRLKKAHGDTPLTAWYNPTAERSEWRTVMKNAGVAAALPVISDPSITLPEVTSVVADYVDPIIEYAVDPVIKNVVDPVVDVVDPVIGNAADPIDDYDIPGEDEIVDDAEDLSDVAGDPMDVNPYTADNDDTLLIPVVDTDMPEEFDADWFDTEFVDCASELSDMSETGINIFNLPDLNPEPDLADVDLELML